MPNEHEHAPDTILVSSICRHKTVLWCTVMLRTIFPCVRSHTTTRVGVSELMNSVINPTRVGPEHCPVGTFDALVLTAAGQAGLVSVEAHDAAGVAADRAQSLSVGRIPRPDCTMVGRHPTHQTRPRDRLVTFASTARHAHTVCPHKLVYLSAEALKTRSLALHMRTVVTAAWCPRITTSR
jgi:hypothetical protein